MWVGQLRYGVVACILNPDRIRAMPLNDLQRRGGDEQFARACGIRRSTRTTVRTSPAPVLETSGPGRASPTREYHDFGPVKTDSRDFFYPITGATRSPGANVRFKLLSAVRLPSDRVMSSESPRRMRSDFLIHQERRRTARERTIG